MPAEGAAPVYLPPLLYALLVEAISASIALEYALCHLQTLETDRTINHRPRHCQLFLLILFLKRTLHPCLQPFYQSLIQIVEVGNAQLS